MRNKTNRELKEGDDKYIYFIYIYIFIKWIF